MSLNKFMHPRNLYKDPAAINFSQLAAQYPDFCKFVHLQLNGKVNFDFKNPIALKTLTRTLLKRDFDLDVDIPDDRLVPTMPLRLNYLLWVEDLMTLLQDVRSSDEPIRGIDIGTGASCVYALLAARKNAWHMLATDIDNDSIECARKNVEKNNLQDKITVKIGDPDKIFKDIIDSDKTYDFCMCNPPFFSDVEELNSQSKSRTGKRPPPRNAHTGFKQEVVAPGGEVEFVKKMIQESKELKKQIRVYTSKLGCHSSVPILEQEAAKAGVAAVAHTRFCQGHTARWGLAWTFYDEVDLLKFGLKTEKATKKNKDKPLIYTVPKEFPVEYSVKLVSQKIFQLLEELEIKYEKVKHEENLVAIQITAVRNTWSHRRRKNREILHGKSESSDFIPLKRKIEETPTDDGNVHKKLKTDENEAQSTKDSCLLSCSLVIRKTGGDILIEMLFYSGEAGKDGMNQVLQYLKNNIK